MYLAPILSDVRRPKWFRCPVSGKVCSVPAPRTMKLTTDATGQIGSRELRR